MGERALAPPPLIVPLLVSVVIVPALDTASPPLAALDAGGGESKPLPPLMAPPLVSVEIVPVLDTPTPPVASPENEEPSAARDRAPDAVDQTADLGPGRVGKPGAAGRIAGAGASRRRRSIMPLLVSFVIEPELATPTPPTPVWPNALPPLIVPLVSLVSVKIAPALAAPTPPARRRRGRSPRRP